MSEKRTPYSYRQTCLITDVVNSNGRMYTKETIRKAIAAKKEDIAQRRFFGMASMPEDGRLPKLSEVSHVVTGLEMDHNKLVADVEILPTPEGHKVLEQIEEGEFFTKHILATAGRGELVKNADGIEEVVNFELDSVNIIPSETWAYKDALDKERE